MTTLDIEIAVIKGFNPRANLIVPNVSWGMHDREFRSLHECDVLILSSYGYATEVEIKISKAYLMKDWKKKNGHRHYLIRRLYYAVPPKLKQIALETIPAHAGLIVITDVTEARRNRITYVR